MLNYRGNWPALIEQARRISTSVVELSALHGEELPGLMRVLHEGIADQFSYASVHAPAKGWELDSSDLATCLATLPSSVSAVVVHPDTLIEPEAFRRLGALLVLENMEPRRATGRRVDELQKLFDLLPEARFCLDVAHAHLCDHSLDLAHDLIDEFADRLAQVHLSSIEEDGRHVPLRVNDAIAFEPLLDRCTGIPWILEALDQGSVS